MKLEWQPRKWLGKKARLGIQGYPAGSVAFYGPDDRRAMKVAIGIIMASGTEPTALKRWFAETGDLRSDDAILAQAIAFLREHAVQSVAMVDGILGCPHEEGGDCPSGEIYPDCPFWAEPDRMEALNRPVR